MSILGFYKEKEGPEEITALVKGDPPDLYVEIPSGIRNRMEIVVGDKIRCLIKDIISKEGNSTTEINEETVWEVTGYWHELHVPPQDANKYRLSKNSYVRLLLKSVVRTGKEVKI